MRRYSLLAALILAAILTTPISAAKAVTLGMADDPTLVRGTADPLLDVGVAHHVGLVRVIASPDRDRGEYLALARNLAGRGLTLHVTLDQPFGARGVDLGPDEFAAWAASMTADLAATDVDLRVALLNEPDLSLPAAGECTPAAVSRIVKSSTATSVTREVRERVRVAKTRTVRRVVRRHGRRVIVKRVVPVTRRVKVRKRMHGRLVTRWAVVPVYRWATRFVAVTEGGEPIERSDSVVDLTPRRECFAIVRARGAAALLRVAIPAVRAAAPGVPVLIGETSPVAGVSTFITELAQQAVPHIDGWADHPYGLGQAAETARLVLDGFGRVPLDWTEFGGHVREGDDAGASAWRGAGSLACSLGVRSLVAYQWQTEPGATWDTSLLDPGLTETERSKVFESIAC